MASITAGHGAEKAQQQRHFDAGLHDGLLAQSGAPYQLAIGFDVRAHDPIEFLRCSGRGRLPPRSSLPLNS